MLVGPNFNHPEFQRLLRKCRHQDAIHFTGTLSSMGVRNELYSADALVISSRVEAQSISVLEALSTGIPVVCTDPIPEYVVGEGQGIRVPVEDVEALTEAMFQMVLTVNDYNPYKLFEHVKSIASPGHVVNRLKEIYSCFL